MYISDLCVHCCSMHAKASLSEDAWDAASSVHLSALQHSVDAGIGSEQDGLWKPSLSLPPIGPAGD